VHDATLDGNDDRLLHLVADHDPLEDAPRHDRFLLLFPKRAPAR
jgi:hypothetical protein